MIPGKKYQRLIVGPEIIPDPRLLHQLIRAYPAGNIIIHLLLVVPFEHFRPKHKPGRILLPEGLGQLKLKPMRHRTVMGSTISASPAALTSRLMEEALPS